MSPWSWFAKWAKAPYVKSTILSRGAPPNRSSTTTSTDLPVSMSDTRSFVPQGTSGHVAAAMAYRSNGLPHDVGQPGGISPSAPYQEQTPVFVSIYNPKCFPYQIKYRKYIISSYLRTSSSSRRASASSGRGCGRSLCGCRCCRRRLSTTLGSASSSCRVVAVFSLWGPVKARVATSYDFLSIGTHQVFGTVCGMGWIWPIFAG